MNLIFIGDVVGRGGREAVKKLVPELRREFNAQFVVVNAENSAAGAGLTASCAADLLTAADVLTAGDHVWDQRGFDSEIARLDRVIRPANLHAKQPGRGWGVFRNPAGGEVAVRRQGEGVYLYGISFFPKVQEKRLENVIGIKGRIYPD